MTDSPHAVNVDGVQLVFGRVPQWDERNARFLAEQPTGATATHATHRAWLPILNQDDVGACEAFQGVDALGMTPLYRKGEVTAAGANDAAFRLYDSVTHADEFPGAWTYNGDATHSPHGSGEDTGTSTLALCKYLVSIGKISRYEWITGDVEQVLHHLAFGGTDGKGTVVLTGWGWTQSMCQPGPGGVIKVSGSDIGGHATVLRGFSRKTQRIRGRNHWTSGWGLRGEYEISFSDVQNRMDEGGDQAVIYR